MFGKKDTVPKKVKKALKETDKVAKDSEKIAKEVERSFDKVFAFISDEKKAVDAEIERMSENIQKNLD